jgi:hypothetical protein
VGCVYTDFEAIAKQWVTNKSPDIEQLEVGRANLLQRVRYVDEFQRANINKAICVLEMERIRLLKNMCSERVSSRETNVILAR